MPASTDLLQQMQAAQLADQAFRSSSDALTQHLETLNRAVEAAMTDLAGVAVDRTEPLADDARTDTARSRSDCERQRETVRALLIQAQAVAVAQGVVVGYG
ncbi:MAG: hypothetical protein KDB86_11525 [Actinobacteria bacterium]|nr:hypothetical protein [Actinomycetota bacterium]MCB9389017.1 hypothetical protein [Acidimicrobiia bacterium]